MVLPADYLDKQQRLHMFLRQEAVVINREFRIGEWLGYWFFMLESSK